MPDTNLNWIDLILVLLLLIFVWHGWQRGWSKVFLEMLSLLTGLLVAVLSYIPAANLISSVFGISYPLAKPLSFLIIWLAAEFTLPSLIELVIKNSEIKHRKKTFSYLLSAPLSLFEGLVVSALVFSLFVSFQTPPQLKQVTLESKLGSKLVNISQKFESWGAGLSSKSSNRETLSAIVTGSGDVNLILWSNRIESFPDPLSEDKLFSLINSRRILFNLPPLILDQSLVVSTRDHGEDMFIRGYLSTISPEGQLPEDRARSSGSLFFKLTEWIVYAPDPYQAFDELIGTELALDSVMSPDYQRIGLGVVNAGSRGKIFVIDLAE